ncbi:outer-membrane lipoprotein carrier protein LolA [Sulfurimonas sp. SAG-AH-194-L11]|nr:LolA-like outer membrane lipoprotein chaperone [Sulfurimonas sp. SAG-AH-194-L11]MDF1876886.1 outer-membrane lipoprotein carrier protein LolA [Sulfurimonas sp. SAG-AH-194-L11]
MKYIFFSALLFTLSFGDIFSMNSFEADFTQVVTNEKGNRLKYTGHIKAMKPQYALWEYRKPSTKFIYVNKNRVMIIEPDLEQVIVKELHNSIDFFKIIKNATKIDKYTYTTNLQSVQYTIHISDSQLKSIEYKDQLDNSVSIDFTNHIINKNMDAKEFTLTIPLNYDVING